MRINVIRGTIEMYHRAGRTQRRACSAAIARRAGRSARRGGLAQRQINAAIGKLVGALIAGITRVAPHPAPIDIVLRSERREPAPQILVLDRLVTGGTPAAPDPVRHPFGDAEHHVLRVRVHDQARTLLQARQRFNHGSQLHPIVGRAAFAAEEFLLLHAGAQPGAPTTRSGIALAGAIGPDFNELIRSVREKARVLYLFRRGARHANNFRCVRRRWNCAEQLDAARVSHPRAASRIASLAAPSRSSHSTLYASRVSRIVRVADGASPGSRYSLRLRIAPIRRMPRTRLTAVTM